MNYVIHYDVCALIIFIVTAFVYFFKMRVPCVRNKFFGLLLGTAAASTFFDLMSVLAAERIDNISLRFFLHEVYYVTHNLVPFWFMMYILVLTENLSLITKRFKVKLYLPMAVNLLLILTSPITDWIIYIDESGTYHRGILQPFCYASAIYYLVFGVIYSFKNRRTLSIHVLRAITSFICMTLLAVIVQLIDPSLLVECFGSALCIMLVMFTLQNQDDMIDSETKLLNRTTFANNCLVNFTNETAFTILLIRIPDFSILMKTFGARFSNRILRSFSEYLGTFVNLGDGYYLEDECFALTFFKESSRVGKVYREIHTKLESNWQVDSVGTLISASFLRIDCPGDALDVETVMEYIEQFKQMDNSASHLLHVRDVNILDKKRRVDVEHAINKALENRGFSVYYQPVYSKEKGRIISCELLIRLNDEALGFIPPAEFIPIAEQNGKILKIGRYVFEEACRFIKKGRAVALGIEYVQVNLSVVQCMQSDLVEQFVNIMDTYKVEPSQICLEITETAAAYTPHIMESNIKRLSAIGVKFALDDYGTGYSNMTYLLNLPFRYIKLEKEIVWAALKQEKARIAIESTIAMIKKLNMLIVAEGIETEQQLSSMLDMNCDFIQGYLFSKPVPENEFIEFLENFEET